MAYSNLGRHIYNCLRRKLVSYRRNYVHCTNYIVETQMNHKFASIVGNAKKDKRQARAIFQLAEKEHQKQEAHKHPLCLSTVGWP